MNVQKMYFFVKWQCENMNEIEESQLIRLIGDYGIRALMERGLLEEKVSDDGKKVYMLNKLRED